MHNLWPAMSVTERFFRLRSVHPFDRLHDSELAMIADAAVVRAYEPGHVIASAGKPMKALIITLEGQLCYEDGTVLPQVFSPGHLLMGAALEQSVCVSGTEPAFCLLIAKSHFFTMLYECPLLTLGFGEAMSTAV
jgi:signal-transduction protein with cAMP-binding, CBS, and nucleotidyltransferase domain